MTLATIVTAPLVLPMTWNVKALDVWISKNCDKFATYAPIGLTVNSSAKCQNLYVSDPSDLSQSNKLLDSIMRDVTESMAKAYMLMYRSKFGLVSLSCPASRCPWKTVLRPRKKVAIRIMTKPTMLRSPSKYVLIMMPPTIGTSEA